MNRDELRRLQKAARDKNTTKLLDWAKQFEQTLSIDIKKWYDKEYTEAINDSFNNLLIALLYSLYYSEETYIDKENINDFLSDFLVTFDMYRTGEYKPSEFVKILADDKIYLDPFDYSKLYREKQERLDKLIEEYSDKLNNLNTLE